MGGTGEGGGEQGSWGERRDREKASSSSALLLPHHLKLSKVLFSFPITFSPLWLNRELLGGEGRVGQWSWQWCFQQVSPNSPPVWGHFMAQ